MLHNWKKTRIHSISVYAIEFFNVLSIMLHTNTYVHTYIVRSCYTLISDGCSVEYVSQFSFPLRESIHNVWRSELENSTTPESRKPSVTINDTRHGVRLNLIRLLQIEFPEGIALLCTNIVGRTHTYSHQSHTRVLTQITDLRSDNINNTEKDGPRRTLDKIGELSRPSLVFSGWKNKKNFNAIKTHQVPVPGFFVVIFHWEPGVTFINRIVYHNYTQFANKNTTLWSKKKSLNYGY